MKLIRSLENNKIIDCVVAIGNFDGVHKGHQCIIESGLNLARKKKKKMGVLTFEPHPKTVFLKKQKFFRITPFRNKFKIIKNLGIDYYFNLTFNKLISQMSASDFIQTILIEKLNASYVVTGKDFVFGKDRSGDIDLLETMAKKSKLFNYISIEDSIQKKGKKYSSSEIRRYLLEGKVEEVKEILGRFWNISGRVIRGEKLARKIGFPTANIDITNYSKLCFGVYIVGIKLLNKPSKIYKGIANYGIKPTFKNNFPLLEVNIFDFNSEIYGENIEITFKSFIRNEKKFKNIEYLQKQIKRDVDISKEYFKNE